MLHTPDEKVQNSEPVFVFLHGRSLCGNNLERVKRYGVLYAMNKGLEVPDLLLHHNLRGLGIRLK